MIFNQTTHNDLRDLFCDAVIKIFGDSMTFLDFLENEMIMCCGEDKE